MADTAKNSKNCILELNFLLEVSTVLADISDSKILVDKLQEIFSEFFTINSFRIFVRDDSTSVFRDFVKDWITIEKNQQEELAENIFNKLEKSGCSCFLLNNKLIKYSSKNLTAVFTDYLTPAKNLLYFPVLNENKTIGVLEINFDKILTEIKIDFFLALQVAMLQISTSVSNKILNQNLQVHINFQNAMKSIAKLIETQFDLNYLLPIIGELIDRFVSDHLIYIFIKEDKGKFRLFWPSDCQDENILKLIAKMKKDKSYIISNNGKTGLFAIRNEDKTTGLIAASSNIDKLSREEINYLLQLSAQASVTTQRANSYAQVLKYATLDALTGLNNRRQFEIRLKQEFASAKRHKKALCCIMLDIDYFKHVNDTWGHSAGDCVLRNVAKIISGELREYDIASRYGGEEFCILLPDTRIKEAAFVAQRLRKAVEKTPINISDDSVLGSDYLNVSISVGVSELDDNFQDAQRLYQCADIALYEAKRRGRNRVVVYDEALEQI